ncbi:ATP-binding protein [Streptomyces yanii]|uniref:ATP-binding protein n=1 Tax=Streptomyces yanii TaxID=78510 RepID=A0ABV5RDM2_9ACTN
MAEPAANAVLHGHVKGRDFEPRHLDLADTLRIEVSDALGEQGPQRCAPTSGAESGYGLRLVEAPPTSWGATDRVVGKTVRAE